MNTKKDDPIIEIPIPVGVVNTDALNEALQTLGDVYLGYALRYGTMSVMLRETATEEEMKLAADIVRRHDPTVLTDAQVNEAEQKQELGALRDELAQPLDPESKTVTIEELTRRVAKLERELLWHLTGH